MSTISTTDRTQQAELERLRLDLATTNRELGKQKELHELERTQWENETASLRSQVDTLQASVNALTTHRQRDTKDRSDSAKGMEDLRAENSKMRREVASLLDTKLSHLRNPQVSFEQYRELLMLCERYATALSAMNGGGEEFAAGAGGDGGAGGSTTAAADAEVIKSAKNWVAGMGGGNSQMMNNNPLTPQEQQHQQQPAHTPTASTGSANILHLDLTKVGAGTTGGTNSAIHSRTASQVGQVGGTDGFIPGGQSRGLVPHLAGVGSVSDLALGGGLNGSADQQRFTGGPQGNGGLAGGANDNRPIRENVVEGGKLVKIIRDAAPNVGKHWSFHNTTTDTQFIVEFTFGPMCDITAIGAEKEGRVYRLSLFPGETKSFVRGLINGYKMAVKYGPPDDSFVPPAAMTDGDLSPQVARAKEVLESAMLGEGGHPDPELAVGGNVLGTPAQQLGYLLEDGLAFIDVAFPPLSESIALQRDRDGAADGNSTVYSLPPLKLLLPSSYLQTGQRAEVLGTTIGPGEVASGSFTTGFYCGALRAVAESKELILKMFSQCTPEESGSGLHYVWLNKKGLWESVALDAYIPCDPKSDLPFGIHSRSQKALWPSLVEKGLAKLASSYATLQTICAATKDGLEALQDLTGFPTEKLDWKTRETTLFNQIHKSVGVLGNIVVLFTPRGENSAQGAELTLEGRRTESIGLELSSMNRVIATVNAEGFRLCLIRVPTQRTTFASAGATGGPGIGKWAGAWSQGSELWNRHPLVRESCEQAKAPVPHTSEDSGTDVIWMDWRDVGLYFEGAGVCYTRPSWVDYRLPTRFTGTKPSGMVELQVLRMTSIYIGVHQGQNTRASLGGGGDAGGGAGGSDTGDDNYWRQGGSPGGAPGGGGSGAGGAASDGKYSAFLITVVGCSPNGVWDTVGQSRGGSFWRGRDVHLALTLRPSDHSYYVLVQRFSADGIKDVTISLHTEHRDAVNVSMRQPSDAVMTAVQYSPVWKFDPTPCPVIPAFPGQVDRMSATFPLSQQQLIQLQHRQQLQQQASVAARRSGGGGAGGNFGHHRVATNMSMGSESGIHGGGGGSGGYQQPGGSASGYGASERDRNLLY